MPARDQALAWLQATCPDEQFRDGKAAFLNATQAYRLSGGKYASHFDTLAAAYAENGDFTHAREWEVKAIAREKSDKKKGQYTARLELYRQQKPYRDEVK